MLATDTLVSHHTIRLPAGLMVVGIICNDYYFRERFEKIEEKLGKTLTK